MSKKNEGGKINVEVPEMALKLIKQKEVSDTNKRTVEQEKENKTIETYAAVLGWYTAEDGVVFGKNIRCLVTEDVDIMFQD